MSSFLRNVLFFIWLLKNWVQAPATPPCQI